MILACNNEDPLSYIFQNIFDICACVCIYLIVLDFTLQFIYGVNGALISFQIKKKYLCRFYLIFTVSRIYINVLDNKEKIPLISKFLKNS